MKNRKIILFLMVVGAVALACLLQILRSRSEPPVLATQVSSTGRDIAVIVTNFGERRVEIDLNLLTYYGTIGFQDTTGVEVELMAREAWKNLAVGIPSSNLVVCRPGESIGWTIDREELVERATGKPYSFPKADEGASFKIKASPSGAVMFKGSDLPIPQSAWFQPERH